MVYLTFEIGVIQFQFSKIPKLFSVILFPDFFKKFRWFYLFYFDLILNDLKTNMHAGPSFLYEFFQSFFCLRIILFL